MSDRAFTTSEVYGRLHRACALVARNSQLAHTDVRLLTALLDCGGRASTLDLEQMMGCESAMIRRSSLVMRPEYVTAASEDGSRTRPGMRAYLTLTDSGRQVAERVRERTGLADA